MADPKIRSERRRRSGQILVRVTPEQLERVRAAAASAGVSVGELIRRRLEPEFRT